MSRDHNLDTDQHRSSRSILRIIGPVILIAGVVLTVVGFGGFFLGIVSSFESGPGFGGPPSSFKLFFLAFLGLPCLLYTSPSPRD